MNDQRKIHFYSKANMPTKDFFLFGQHRFGGHSLGDTVEIKPALPHPDHFRVASQLFVIVIIKIFFTRLERPFRFVHPFRKKMLRVEPDTRKRTRIEVGYFYPFFTGIFLSADEIYNSSPVEGAFHNFSHIVFVGVEVDVSVSINQHTVTL